LAPESLYPQKKLTAPRLFIPPRKAGICHDAEQPKVTQLEIWAKETAGKPDRTLDILKALNKLAARCATQSLNPDEP
tara:strand:- start:677 stop:907 length:231 start_codon:yes stop_codon:yes gene_type:complete